jgi:hypothetical protein
MSPRHRLRLWSRSRLLLLGLAVAAVVFLAGSVFAAQLWRQEAQDLTGVVEQQRDATAAQAASLAEQIQAECAAGTLTVAVCQQAAVVAATPIPGPTGPQGIPGQAGEPGTAGEPGPAGSAGPTGEAGEPGVAGTDGRDGLDGRDGTDGVDGRDGDPGPTGPSGEPGPAGADGRDGEDGAPPASFSIDIDEDTYLCSRDNTDDAAPTYSCSTGAPDPGP